MEENDLKYTELVKSFGLVLNQYRLYSEKHPAAQLAVRNFGKHLHEILSGDAALTLGCAGGRLIVNDLPLDAKQNAVIGLLKECERLGVESLTFDRDVDESEITSFFKLLALPPKVLAQKGGLTQAVAQSGLKRIRLGTIRYMAVGDEEKVIEKSDSRTKDEGDGEPPRKQVRKIEKMEEVIEYFLKGSSEEVTFDTERLSYELDRNPKAVAEAMVRRATQQDMLKIIVKAVEGFLKQCLAPLYLQQGRDFSQTIYTLAKEFNKTLKQVGIKRRGDLVFPLERCADTIKVELMVKAYRDGDQKLLERTAKGSRKGARDDLKERLADLGVGGNVFAGLFSETPKQKSRRVYIPVEELEELRRIRDRFEEEVSLRVSERTDILEQSEMTAVRDRERVEKILRNLGQALVVVDSDGKVQMMNPAAERLLRVGAKEAKDVAIHELVKEDHLLVLAQDSQNEGMKPGEDIQVTTKNEETRRLLQGSAVVLENADGKIIGMVSALNNHPQQTGDELKSRFAVSTSPAHPIVPAGEG